MTTGTLTQPIVQVVWDGENLSAYENSDGELEVIAQQVQLDLDKEGKAPSCSFMIAPTPLGFEVFAKLKKNSLQKPFTVTITYPNSQSKIKQKFRFAGMEYTTGMNPRLSIKGVSAVKGCWTDNKISFTMEKEMSLKAFGDLVKEKAGECAKELSLNWGPAALEEAQKIMVKINQTQRPPHTILADALRPHGMLLEVGDTAFGGEMSISFSAALKEELQKDKPEVKEGEKEAEPIKRKVYIVGPGLMIDFTRSQSFNVGSSKTKEGTSTTSSITNETNQKKVVEPNSAPQEETSKQKTTTATKGKSNASSSESGTVVPGSKDEDAQAALARIITTTCSFDVPMLPYMVGIKPRDLIALPSLAGPGDFIEDWEVETVSYRQDQYGGVTISIAGRRPYTGGDPMLDEGTLESVKGTVSDLTTPAKWNKFYWVQGPDEDYPLTS